MWKRRVLLAALTVLAGACNKQTAPAPTPTPAATIRITAAGVNPKNVDIALGARVLFINNDAVEHDMGSDPHPDHTDCPPLNQVGVLKPGEQRETGNFVIARICGFHDHNLPDVTALWGTIVTK